MCIDAKMRNYSFDCTAAFINSALLAVYTSLYTPCYTTYIDALKKPFALSTNRRQPGPGSLHMMVYQETLTLAYSLLPKTHLRCTYT